MQTLYNGNVKVFKNVRQAPQKFSCEKFHWVESTPNLSPFTVPCSITCLHNYNNVTSTLLYPYKL